MAAAPGSFAPDEPRIWRIPAGLGFVWDFDCVHPMGIARLGAVRVGTATLD